MEDFFEKYELLGVEKECESTKIYKARNKVDGNFVCMYLLADDCCSEFINDVYDNLDMYKNINNENIMKIYNTGKCLIDGVNYYFIEKEYIEGKSLDDILKDLGRLDVDKALIIARHILDGLDYFYKNKSCDGNLRPRNIFVGTDSEVKLDLLVYPKHDECDLGYTSPEQAIVDYITIYDDIYSLGAILFRMITGRLPFGEFESREDVFKVVSGGLYFKEEDGLDDKLRYLFVKSLQARPLDRYFDLQEWMVDIDEYLKSMEEDRKIVVIDGSDVNTYHLDDEILPEDIDNCNDTLDIDEDINVINSDGSIKDIEDVVKNVENDLGYLEGEFEDDSIEGTSKEVENIDEVDCDQQVAEVINMNVVNTQNDELLESSNMNSSKIDTDKYSYTDNELHIDDKNDYKTEIMEEENDEDEEVEVDGDDEDYGSEKGTKRLKVMVGVLSVAVCLVGVASFTFIKDMVGGSESHDDGSSQGEPVINMDDSEDEEDQNQDAPTVDNNEEDANTNEEETNPEESKTQEETNPGENTTNPGNNTDNNHTNNQNNNQNNNGNNNNSNNNNSQNKPEDGNQNGGNNNGGNNGSNNGNNNNGNNGNDNNNNNGSNNNGSDNNGGTEGGNPESPENPANPENPDNGSDGNDSNNQNPPADNPSDNNGEGQQPQADQPAVQ
ncbi:hypothetical protein CHL78_009635 [Romboutsia weinsteinii]|uniref:non-specific serine/threonine protein kinase n=1 Tax=Romboutsia weinsteinii TaxID=2020949 RepID=A0A371J459_9FIRM|nr:protein kinase [Romboutsia weinsteinii]RDY27464.1 hypothetical protein CHL78_009635 [Romboutsia weinsteinii]